MKKLNKVLELISHPRNSIRGIRGILKKSVMQTVGHRGELKVGTRENEGKEFIVLLNAK